MVKVAPFLTQLSTKMFYKFSGCCLRTPASTLSLDHASGTVYLLLFATLTHLRASENCWKRFCLSDGQGAGGIELTPLNELTNLLSYVLTWSFNYS